MVTVYGCVWGDEDNDNYDQLSEFSESESESGINLIKFSTVARECDRYGISDIAGAAIATSARLQNMEL